ncbi:MULTISPECIES: glycerophosphodiester phosphodiesterase [Bacillaceae]|uniref:Glycerophosphodiester phosphodiesterase n=1 Tax=Evansella alkalicola TaxID=745819 RepID=A0ABS6JR48_9BACI|nr:MULTISPECIES: glycerophosphodiester phosphodiesterase [Bacillaceae]MBU9721029.1 glycerophosphodiester phosphodiesterase [Bacillus alkalicola]
MKISVIRVSNAKKSSAFKKLGLMIGIILILWLVIYFFPVSERPMKPFFENEGPMVIAHQGGEHLAPSNTLEAFHQAVEMGVDALEFDIHMTKDGHLVAIHDNTVDRTTNGTGRVNDLTLDEIQELDAGYYFQDLSGDYSFRGKGVKVPTVEELFESIPDMRWVIEIKATNDPELYEPIGEKLWELIQQYRLEDNVLIASFDQDITEMVTNISSGRVAMGGGRREITKFVVFHKLFLNSLYRPQAEAIQIPTEEGRFNLKDAKLIRGADRRGMDVHYWTINDKDEMRELIDLGADGIITDRPDLMIELLEEEY